MKGSDHMARSLKSQVIHAISTSFYGDQERGISGGFGTSKHSDKISNQKAGKIYSYDCYNNRQDIAKEFCGWMKNEHPEIRRASDLTERHATEFLAKKSSEVSTNTLTNIRSQLKGIASAINHTYQSADVSLDTPVMSGTTDRNVKTVSMVKSDYVKLVDSYKDAYSTGATGARVIYSSGLRASEVCTLKGSDITVKDGVATVHVANGKGGRMRDVVITDKERVDTLKDISDHFMENRVCDIKPQSLEINISRHLNSIETDQEYKYNSCHAIRKEYAQNTYDQHKESGCSSSEAWGKTCESLGHSADRQALFNTYISKP
jgi:integrase